VCVCVSIHLIIWTTSFVIVWMWARRADRRVAVSPRRRRPASPPPKSTGTAPFLPTWVTQSPETDRRKWANRIKRQLLCDGWVVCCWALHLFPRWLWNLVLCQNNALWHIAHWRSVLGVYLVTPTITPFNSLATVDGLVVWRSSDARRIALISPTCPHGWRLLLVDKSSWIIISRCLYMFRESWNVGVSVGWSASRRNESDEMLRRLELSQEIPILFWISIFCAISASHF
jgi:hypothetical protein